MYIYIYVISKNIQTCMYTQAPQPSHVYICICICICICIYIYIYIYICICIYMYVYKYIYIYICMYIYIYIHIHTSINNRYIIWVYICIYVYMYPQCQQTDAHAIQVVKTRIHCKTARFSFWPLHKTQIWNRVLLITPQEKKSNIFQRLVRFELGFWSGYCCNPSSKLDNMLKAFIVRSLGVYRALL